MNLEKIIKEVLNEVRYLDPKGYNIPKEKPVMDTETIRVYHGFYSEKDVFEVVTRGLSGKESARRVYSYESGNNPYGLFVTTDFNVANKFASSGVIIEFTAKVSDLEAPVWSGGGSYFKQGQMTTSFNPDTDEREQQRLINRDRASKSEYEAVSKSDRPELGETLFDNPERQALYTGDLNPNMIKRVWYNEIRDKKNRTDGSWIKYSVKDFIKLKNITKNTNTIKFLPNDDFTIEKFKSFLRVNDEKQLKAYIKQIFHNLDNYRLKQYGFWPKQIKQIKDLHSKGYFDKYLNENINESINPENSYEYNIFNKNNKIGFYYFKNKDGIEYDVRMSLYQDEIEENIYNVLDIEFAADNKWKELSNVSDKFKVLSTIANIIKDYYQSNKNNIDYITYVLDRNDNSEKRNKIYQYILKNIGIKLLDVKKINSNIYCKIKKDNIVSESSSTLSEHKLFISKQQYK